MNKIIPGSISNLSLGAYHNKRQFAKLTARLAVLAVGILCMFKTTVNAQTTLLNDNFDTYLGLTQFGSTTNYYQSNIADPNIPSSNLTFINQSSGLSPQDGYYVITTSTNLDNTNHNTGNSYALQTYAWLPDVYDHTYLTSNKGHGYFALINGGATHTFYSSPTLTTLGTQGITVSFWAQNIISNYYAPTDVTPKFDIEVFDAVTGALIGETSAPTSLAEVNEQEWNSHFTGSTIETPNPYTWQQFTLSLPESGHTKIKVELIDETAASGIIVGNDFALDDVTVVEAPCTTAPGTPVIGTITQPTCSTNTGSIAVSGLPSSGTWRLINTLSTDTTSYTGTGTTTTLSGLAPGSYKFYVVNATGCISALPSTATAVLVAPVAAPLIPIQTSITQPTCSTSTGSITVTSVGGTKFSVDGGTSVAATSILLGVGTYTVSGLSQGTHYITAFNSSSCASPNYSFTVTTPNAPTMPTLVGLTQPGCSGTTGSITVISTLGVGTTGTIMYSLDGGTQQTSGTFTGISTGAHSIAAFNGTGCESVAYDFVIASGSGNSYTWSTNASSSDPTSNSNWQGGTAPGFTAGNESITIPNVNSGKSYPKLISTFNSGVYSIFNLTISGNAASLNLNGCTLNVGCNIANSATTASTGGTGGVINYNSNLNSTLNWDGTTNQSYTGNVYYGTFTNGNMSVSNTGATGNNTVTLQSGPVDIYNTLNMNSGNLAIGTTTNSLLTLKSSSTQTATVTAIPSTSAITGTVNVERYISGVAAGGSLTSGFRGYRLISSPVYSYAVSGVNCYTINYLNANTYATFQNQTTAYNAIPAHYGALTGGPGGTIKGFSITNPTSNPTIYLYDESKMSVGGTFTTGKNVGVTAVTTSPSATSSAVSINYTPSTAQIPVGNGYIFYFIGSNANTTYLSSTRAPDSTRITATGTLNQGSIPVYLWKTPTSTSLSFTTTTGNSTIGVATAQWGLNQVGNPYASTISLDQLYADNTTGSNASNPIGSSFWELKEPGQTYVAYVSGGRTQSTYASDYIASGQGFLVQATNPGATLTFNEDQKFTQQFGQSSLSSPGTPEPLLLSLKMPAANTLMGLHLQIKKDSITQTQTGIYFDKKASDTYNKSEDAVDLDGVAPQVYLSSYTSDGTRVGINSLAAFTAAKTVKLYVNATASGPYTLGMADIKNIDTIYNVSLVDNLLKDSVDLRKNVYNFTINTSDTTTFGANRFQLSIRIKSLPPYKLVSFTGQKVTSGVQLAWKTNNEGDYTGFAVQKLSGSQFVPLYDAQSTGASVYGFVDSHPLPGVNTYRLQQNGVLGDITYSQAVLVDYNNLNSQDILSVYPNPANSNVNINLNLLPAAFKLTIYNVLGKKVKDASLTGNYWTQDVSALTAGTYIVEVHDSNGNFIGKTKFVKAQ